MGMKAEVLAIGQFDKRIADCLEYPSEFYEDTLGGRVVMTQLFQCATTNQSNELAEYMGVEPWDFNTHLISPRKITAEARAQLRLIWDDDIDHFDRLEEAGFKFIYCPNG